MPEQARRRAVVGNWKMYKTHAEAESYFADLLPRVKDTSVEVDLAVPFTLIQMAAQLTSGTKIRIGAQNMNDASEGAFTGEIAARMLVEAGAKFVILGHSERRRLFGETDALVNRKLKQALQNSLEPILCVGETLAERQDGKTHEVLERQIKEGLAGIPPEQLDKLYIAYEPVWAIGAGKTAAPQIAEEAHTFIRQSLTTLTEPQMASRTILLYGGSVHPRNSGALLEQPNVDGLLVGGASLSPELFGQIVNAFHTSPLGKDT